MDGFGPISSCHKGIQVRVNYEQYTNMVCLHTNFVTIWSGYVVIQ